MASTVIANEYRARLADFHGGGSPLSPFGFMAFGDGGHNPDGTPKLADPDASGLQNELIRKPLNSITRTGPYTLECEGRLEPGELIGKHVSEAALLDAAGQVVAFKKFAPKVRDSDELYQVFIEPLF
ncbi:phage tail protein [Alcaligenaceae bacterium]|nr:phage tail protein [Alcaligenaceae bacterium]